MKKILIQANNLDTVVDVFMYIYMHPECTHQDVADYCGFTLRQVQYYANACKYLDLINEDWSKTALAIDIFTNHPTEVKDRVYARIISDEVMGQIFARMILLPDGSHDAYAVDVVKEYFPGYSDAVYERRADNIVKWCKKIISYIKLKG